MSNDTMTTVAYFLKTVFDQGLADETLRLHPTLDMMEKIADFFGDSITYAVRIANAQNIASSATGISGLAAAQAVGSASKGVKFNMTRVRKTGTISMDIEAIAAAIGRNDGSFENLLSTEVDGLNREFTNRLGFDLFRDGTGKRGQRLSAAVNVVTLATPDDARNFQVNMVVGASPNADGSGARVGTTAVAGVDYDAGTVTLVSAAAIAAFADNDFMFASPEISNNLQGFGSCTPLVAPTSTLFRNVDRTANIALLAGARLNDTTSMIEENAGRCAVKVMQNGGIVDSLVLNPQRAWEMLRRLGAKIVYQGGGGTAKYGFEAAMISTPAGDLRVIPDPDCPMTEGRGFHNPSHKIRSLKEFIHLGNEDGKYELRMPTDDALEARCRSMSQYQQTEPRNHFVFAI